MHAAQAITGTMVIILDMANASSKSGDVGEDTTDEAIEGGEEEEDDDESEEDGVGEGAAYMRGFKRSCRWW